MDEAPDHDVIAHLLVRLFDVGLREEGLLGDPFTHPALDDLLRDVLGLAQLGDLLLDNLPLFLYGRGRDVLWRDAHRPHGGHVERHVAGELLEFGRARHEIRLAVDLDEDANPSVEVHVSLDEALGRSPPALLCGQGLAPLPENLPRAFDVPFGLLERTLHVHHPRRSLLPELLDLLYRTSQSSYFSSVSS